MNNTVTVEIAGCSYQIKTDESPEYVQELANFVAVKILEIKRDSGASSLDCATMAALDIADRYYKEVQKKKPRKKSTAETETEPTTIF